MMKIIRIAQYVRTDEYYQDLNLDFDRSKIEIKRPTAPCPIIDSLIQSTKDIQNYASSIQKTDNLDDIFDYASSIEMDISDFYDKLEQIRRAYEMMDDSSKSWYKEAKRYMKIINEMK
jgi:hypothetical protein